MGKRKDMLGGNEEEGNTESPGSSHKKHKKHKKKHKKKREMPDEQNFDTPGTSSVVSAPKPAIKLKLMIGGKTMGMKSITPIDNNSVSGTGGLSADEPIVDIIDEPWHCTVVGEDDTFHTKKPGDETSDEEKAWLDALESGDLEDFEEKQKQKDPTLMTARQRALHHGKQDRELLQLPSGYKTVELTEEQIQRRQQRAKKRRQQAQEKREKDKKLTLDRLLKKQETKQKGPKSKGSKRSNVPRVRYSNKMSGITVSMPVGFNFPFRAQPNKDPPKQKERCGVIGCLNPKKYNCSKTGVPLCSLQCYKRNLSLHSKLTPLRATLTPARAT